MEARRVKTPGPREAWFTTAELVEPRPKKTAYPYPSIPREFAKHAYLGRWAFRGDNTLGVQAQRLSRLRPGLSGRCGRQDSRTAPSTVLATAPICSGISTSSG